MRRWLRHLTEAGGKIPYRVAPEIRRDVTAAAKTRGKSLDAWLPETRKRFFFFTLALTIYVLLSILITLVPGEAPQVLNGSRGSALTPTVRRAATDLALPLLRLPVPEPLSYRVPYPPPSLFSVPGTRNVCEILCLTYAFLRCALCSGKPGDETRIGNQSRGPAGGPSTRPASIVQAPHR